MIRGHRFRHLCCGDFCAVCAWEAGIRWGSSLRPLTYYERFLLKQIGESGSIAEPGSTGAETPADPYHTALPRTAKA
jgi:hypothetical protein